MEEAGELADAGTTEEVIHEGADLLYFLTVALARSGVTLSQVEEELDRRSQKVSRRPPRQPDSDPTVGATNVRESDPSEGTVN